MKFQQGRSKTDGRKAGTPNKVSLELKDAIIEAYKARGGVAYLKSLPDNLFLPLLNKLVPNTVGLETNFDSEEPVQSFYILGLSDPETIKRKELEDFKAKVEAYRQELHLTGQLLDLPQNELEKELGLSEEELNELYKARS